jgi:hypothetical protein
VQAMFITSVIHIVLFYTLTFQERGINSIKTPTIISIGSIMKAIGIISTMFTSAMIIAKGIPTTESVRTIIDR